MAKNRSRTTTRVPGAPADGTTGDTTPPSTLIARALSAPAGREVIASRAAAPIEGSASPRKPSVAMRTRSSSASFEVAWRCTDSASAAAFMPHAVVGDLDAIDAAAVECDGDAGRAGVERVLHQLLHRRGGALDHLAGGDAVDDALRQDADGGRVRLGRVQVGHGQPSPRSARKRAISAAVEPSCAPATAPGVSSGSTPPANSLPSSTPHWSKLSIPHRQPCTATLCS